MMDRKTFMELAWRGFVSWAWSQTQFKAQFTHETGIQTSAEARAPIERAIDRATSHDPVISVAREFTLWVTIFHWGESEAPASVQREIAGHRARVDVPAWLLLRPEPELDDDDDAEEDSGPFV